MNIWILNTLESGIDIIDLIIQELPISGVIGLSHIDRGDHISGYLYQRPYCLENNIQFVELESYNFKKLEDQKQLRMLQIDILVVVGWQRLVPNWLISHCSKCVIGIHGSMDGISGGRGRSPQNWSLIYGASDFSLSIFRIDEGIDSGDIIDTRMFSFSIFDDIKTSNYKVSILSASMIVDAIKSGKIDCSKFSKQEGEFRYLPQRKPEDGYIDWNRSSLDIYNFVRALTTPYPGALTRVANLELKILCVKPFYMENTFPNAEPGEVVKKFITGDFLVKTKDSFVLVNDYSIENGKEKLHAGIILESVDFYHQIELIKDRHYEKYPEMQLHEVFN